MSHSFGIEHVLGYLEMMFSIGRSSLEFSCDRPHPRSLVTAVSARCGDALHRRLSSILMLSMNASRVQQYWKLALHSTLILKQRTVTFSGILDT